MFYFVVADNDVSVLIVVAVRIRFVVVVVSDTPESEFVWWGEVALDILFVSNLTMVDTHVALWLSWRFCLLR